MKNQKIILIVGIVIIVGLVVIWKGGFHNTSSVDYKNATYIVEGQSVTFINGTSEVQAAPGSASKVITQYFGNEVFGDLNGDGQDDVAFLITQNSGGSGTFYYVVAALKSSNGYNGTNAILLGDRIAPQTLELRNGTLTVNYADRLANEPMTAEPSIGKSKYLIIQSNKLLEVSAQQ